MLDLCRRIFFLSFLLFRTLDSESELVSEYDSLESCSLDSVESEESLVSLRLRKYAFLFALAMFFPFTVKFELKSASLIK